MLEMEGQLVRTISLGLTEPPPQEEEEEEIGVRYVKGCCVWQRSEK